MILLTRVVQSIGMFRNNEILSQYSWNNMDAFSLVACKYLQYNCSNSALDWLLG